MRGIDDPLVDHPSIPAEAEVFIRGPWAGRTAYAIAGQNPTWWDYVDDLAQEARLTMWSEAANWDGRGQVIPFIIMRARWRITSIIQGRQQYTGHLKTDQRGYARERNDEGTLVPVKPADSLNALLDDVGFEAVDAVDHIEHVLRGYHDGEIAQAISELPEAWQKYIRLKFWEGMAERDIVEVHGNYRKQWRTVMIPALQARLAYLVDA